jgi:hypothetical protein
MEFRDENCLNNKHYEHEDFGDFNSLIFNANFF